MCYQPPFLILKVRHTAINREDNGINTHLGNLSLQLADSLAPLSQSTLKARDLIGPQP